MSIIDLFSKRKKAAAEAGAPEVYVYDKIPAHLRVQIQQIFKESIGTYYQYTGNEFSDVPNNNGAWEFLHKTLCREYGVHRLSDGRTPYEDIMLAIAKWENVDRIVDIFELGARYIERVASKLIGYNRTRVGISQESSEAIDELNYRFRSAAVGYQYVDGTVVRVDSEYLHAEVVKPALALLAQSGFEGPNSEFLEAHKHYRAGKNKDAITWANKAFESTMKAICDQKGWPCEKGARASDLLKVVRKHGLLPDYLDASFDQLAATLASGLPQLRNNVSAHGDGAHPLETPSYIAAYALHLAAAKIVLLMSAASQK